MSRAQARRRASTRSPVIPSASPRPSALAIAKPVSARELGSGWSAVVEAGLGCIHTWTRAGSRPGIVAWVSAAI